MNFIIISVIVYDEVPSFLHSSKLLPTDKMAFNYFDFFFVGCILLNKNVKVKKTNKQQLQVVHIGKTVYFRFSCSLFVFP